MTFIKSIPISLSLIFVFASVPTLHAALDTAKKTKIVQPITSNDCDDIEREILSPSIEEKDEKIQMLNKEINKKDNQLKEKDQIIEELQSELKKLKEKVFSMKALIKEKNAIYPLFQAKSVENNLLQTEIFKLKIKLEELKKPKNRLNFQWW